MHDYMGYKNLAIELATTKKSKLEQLRSNLFANRLSESKPFFNNLQWVRDWEDILWSTWEKEVQKKNAAGYADTLLHTAPGAANFGSDVVYMENYEYNSKDSEHFAKVQDTQGTYFGKTEYGDVECDGFIC